MLNIQSDAVQTIIQEVADTVILPHYRCLCEGEVQFKSVNNPVTIADLESERALRNQLMALLPGSTVVGEEDFEQNPDSLNLFKQDVPVWIVDPVDGTKHFIAGEPYFGIIVALALDNETIMAWLYDPCSRQFITAEKGAGAFHNGKKLKVLEPDVLTNLRGVMGARLLADYAQNETITSDGRKPSFSRMLSSCHDYARLVAPKPHFSGKLEQMHFHCWKETCTPWDNAAGVLINEEAGGFTAHWNEEAFKPSHYHRGLLTAPNRACWRLLRDWIMRFSDLPEI